MIGGRIVFFALLMAGTVTPALAQVAADGGVVFEADYFASAAPRTALDMVERVPGFILDEGEERRGFAGAQSNVLIDGEPPASKEDIDDVLSRIPASDVVRIELIRGAAGAGSGQSVRVNVVRRPSSGEGVWELELERARDGRVTPSGEVAWTGRRGPVDYGLTAAIEADHLPIRGERTDYDGLGAVEERRRESVPTDEREARLGAEASMPLAGGHASVTGQFARIELDETEQAALFAASSDPAGSIDTEQAERENLGEIGLSYRRSLGGWDGELGALISRRRFSGDETSLEYDDLGAFAEGAVQSQRIESGETILRAAGEHGLGEAWRVQIGIEAALNTLEQRLSLTEDDGSGPEPVILPSANVRVEEERAEASILLTGALAPNWALEAGGAVETSVLTQEGDVNLRTELTYWKPTLQIARTLGRDQVRLRFYRDVGQLDFEDFVSAADITSAIVDGGNPNLRPETSWRLEVAGDWRFGDDGALSLTLYRWWVEDALDIVPVGPPGDQVDAPGNIGDADVTGLRAALSLPLPFDAELRIEGVTQRSEVIDPLTSERRAISEFDESEIAVRLRQEFEAVKIAWGIEYERDTETPSWRLDRIQADQDADDLMLWIETTAFVDVKFRAWVSNLRDSDDTRDRRLFDPDRLGTLDGFDERARGEGVSFGASVSGVF